MVLQLSETCICNAHCMLTNEKCTKSTMIVPKKSLCNSVDNIINALKQQQQQQHIGNLSAKYVIIWQTEASVACGKITHWLTHPLYAGLVTHCCGKAFHSGPVTQNTNPVHLVTLAQRAGWADSRSSHWVEVRTAGRLFHPLRTKVLESEPWRTFHRL